MTEVHKKRSSVKNKKGYSPRKYQKRSPRNYAPVGGPSRVPVPTAVPTTRPRKFRVNPWAVAAGVTLTGLTAAYLLKNIKHPKFPTPEEELKFYVKTLETCKTEYFLLEKKYEKELSEMTKKVGEIKRISRTQRGGNSEKPETFREFLAKKLKFSRREPETTWESMGIIKNEIEKCKAKTFDLIKNHTQKMRELQKFIDDSKM